MCLAKDTHEPKPTQFARQGLYQSDCMMHTLAQTCQQGWVGTAALEKALSRLQQCVKSKPSESKQSADDTAPIPVRQRLFASSRNATSAPLVQILACAGLGNSRQLTFASAMVGTPCAANPKLPHCVSTHNPSYEQTHTLHTCSWLNGHCPLCSAPQTTGSSPDRGSTAMIRCLAQP